jgi:hypothetical protein
MSRKAAQIAVANERNGETVYVASLLVVIFGCHPQRNAQNLKGNGHFCFHLDSLKVLGLPTLRAFGHVELHGLPFL